MTDAKLTRAFLRNVWGSSLAALLFTAFSAQAEPVHQVEGWGLGVMLGYPVSGTAKYWLGGPNAWDLGVGAGPGLRIHGDFDWGLAQLLTNKSDLTLDLYLGLGAVFVYGAGYCGFYGDRFCGHNVFAGVRAPFGIDARLQKAPVSFGLEAAPGILFGSYVNGLLDVFLFVRVIL